jgi:adenine-specific DNA-methyltransferase
MRRTTVPKTVWKSSAHTAGGQGGTVLLNNLLGERNLFTYPKSLYAVEDAVAAAVGDQPGAIVLDFFAGSGTTAHAVARLNQKDGGHRQSVTVTNNEVSASDADALRKQGLRPGDTGWEVAGIYERVTRPRIEAAIRGSRPNGEPIPSKLRYLDGPKMAEGFEENVTFAELVYLDPDDVELGLAFAAVAPLLWLRAGAQGPIIEECLDSAGRRKPYAWTERYGVLFNPDRWRSFVEKLPATATTAFVVTDSQAIFAGVTAELPDHLEVVRLYENYLTTFRINEGLG